MTPPNTPRKDEVREIAEALSEAQREALIAGKWNVHEHAIRLCHIGILRKTPGYFVELTPLGLEIRAYLKESGDD